MFISKNDEDENLIYLGAVPKIFLSEMMSAVQGIKEVEKKDI